MTLADAYAECERQATTHYENFPVASWVLPRRMRRHVAAIYAFARTADDLADEGHVAPETRLAQLDAWLARLHEAIADPPERSGSAAPVAPVFMALPASIRACALPVGLFDDLVSAFKQDVVRTRYESWDDLLDYCSRSANPVGRLVLRVAGIADERVERASDAVCTALQLTNFWQDVAIDWSKGRVYMPRAERERWGAREDDLASRQWTPAWRAAADAAATRTYELFDAGRPVCDAVPGRLRLELRLTWLGGRRILDRLKAIGYDAFASRPSLGPADLPGLLWQALSWRS